MRQRVAVSALHLGLSAEEAYEVLRDFERNERLTDAIRSVHLERGDDGSQVSFWELELQSGVLRWSQHDEPDDVNRRIRFHRRDGDPAELAGEWSVVEGPDGCRIGFDCELNVSIPPLSGAVDPIVARVLRESVTERLEGVFGPELLVDRCVPREPTPTVGI
jgi:uncharacterized membrane protein